MLVEVNIYVNVVQIFGEFWKKTSEILLDLVQFLQRNVFQGKFWINVYVLRGMSSNKWVSYFNLIICLVWIFFLILIHKSALLQKCLWYINSSYKIVICTKLERKKKYKKLRNSAFIVSNLVCLLIFISLTFILHLVLILYSAVLHLKFTCTLALYLCKNSPHCKFKTTPSTSLG